MTKDELLRMLEVKDTAEAYRALLELERISEEDSALYTDTERFARMTESDRYAIRVRGFRLFCKQARWDTENQINQNLARVMAVLQDEKPTAVRQALAALCEVVRYKPELSAQIDDAIREIDFLQYKDSMQGLIRKDICALSEEIGRKNKNGI